MRLLDLFCGAGGAAVGYQRAGFTEIVGVDNRPMPRYPFEFVQADALEYLEKHGREFDVIHASPPCQAYSLASFVKASRSRQDLVTPCIRLLEQTGKVWVVENVPRAPLGHFSITLCGLMFGIGVFRHRRFATSHLVFVPKHPSHAGHQIGKRGMVCVAGHGDASWRYRGRNRAGLDDSMCRKAAWEKGMGIDWMTRDELSQAIPPAYTEWIGKRLLESLGTGEEG